MFFLCYVEEKSPLPKIYFGSTKIVKVKFEALLIVTTLDFDVSQVQNIFFSEKIFNH